MRLYDITPVVSERLAVWPGDTPASREVLLDIEAGDNLTLSTCDDFVLPMVLYQQCDPR